MRHLHFLRIHTLIPLDYARSPMAFKPKFISVDCYANPAFLGLR